VNLFEHEGVAEDAVLVQEVAHQAQEAADALVSFP